MRGEIHLLVGAALAAPFLHLGAPAAALAAGALGSVLPDVDHPGSFLGRYVPWPAVTVPNHRTGFVATGRRWFGGRVIWHRGETHSLGAALAAGVLSLAGGLALDQGVPWAAWLALAALAGYVSHLVLDLANPTPRMLLWPWSRKRIRPERLPALPDGSLPENALEALLSCLALASGWTVLGPDALWRLREVVRP